MKKLDGPVKALLVAVVLAGVVTGLILRRHVRRRVDQMEMQGARPNPSA